MKKIIIILIALILGFKVHIRADEGMWIPMLAEELVYMQMKKMGLELTPEEIYSLNQSSLKDAIVIFGRGCTGEIVSPEGLLFTNHHCGYGSIQSVSTPEDNYLKDGFWAMNKSEEIPIEGLTVQFLVKIVPASEDVLKGVSNDMTEEERDNIIHKNSQALISELTDGTHYNAIVRPFFEGNEYYAFVYETFKDIRLVGTPPESIGKFGADTDNWMWPRHTGDFSIFRVYTAPNGRPAYYSEDNVPLKPKHFLPVSVAGVEEGDFAMILGYPGSTDRYLASTGVKTAIDEYNPTFVDIRAEKLAIMMDEMKKDEAVRLQYASKYARTANYWKYYIGQTKGLKRLNVYGKKKELENQFSEWLNDNPDAMKKFGGALDTIELAYKEIEQYNLPRLYYNEAIFRGPEILGFANNIHGFSKNYNKEGNTEKDNQLIINFLKSWADTYFKNYNESIDRNMLANMLEMFYNNVPQSLMPEEFKDIAGKYKGDFTKFADKLFEKSVFANEEVFYSFLEKFKLKTVENDPAYKLYRAFRDTYNSQISPEYNAARKLLSKGKRYFIAGLREMNPDKQYYPDANFTMRLSYGVVDDYYPADAVHFNYFTTMDGIMQKEDPNSWEFIVPEKLKSLYEAKDFGIYGEGDVMKVCFLTNHDITGGNSGSPVINAKGELIGLAFDGNWEAMSGDIAFEPELQRTINVDVRYVLFIIDKFAGAQNLIDELLIVKE